MDKDGKVSFRESFYGYNKEDVNKYILDMNTRYSELEGDYKVASVEQRDQLEKLKAKYDALSAEKADIEAELREKLAQSEALIAAQRESEAAKDEELERLRRELEAVTETSQKTEEEAGSLRRELGEMDSAKNKAELYDKMSARLGDVLLRAREQADGILSEARENAARVTSDAEELAKALSDDAETEREKAVEEVKERLARFSDEAEKRLTEAVSGGAAEYISTLETVKSSADSIIWLLNGSAAKAAQSFTEEKNKILGELEKFRENRAAETDAADDSAGKEKG